MVQHPVFYKRANAAARTMGNLSLICNGAAALGVDPGAEEVALGAPDLVVVTALPLIVADIDPEFMEEEGISPAGIDMTPVTVERSGSVIMEATV